jgi:N-acetyl-gamma-glutamyl-phosphate reductase
MSPETRRVRVAVLGATGYTGVELLRLLARHPNVELTHLSSEQYRGKRADEVYPFLSGVVDATLGAPDPAEAVAAADIVFAALPHGASAAIVVECLRRGARVLDLSADFRFRDADVFARWYGAHPAPELLAEAVYGLPELYRDRLPSARLVAVPGCYPTGALLGLTPLARAGLRLAVPSQPLCGQRALEEDPVGRVEQIARLVVGGQGRACRTHG